MVDELRFRLTQELQRQKERELSEQKEKYERKFAKLRQVRKEPKRKILSPLELYNKQEKGRKEVEEYKTKAVYPKTFSGRITKGVRGYIAGRTKQLEYAEELKRSPYAKRGKLTPRERMEFKIRLAELRAQARNNVVRRFPLRRTTLSQPRQVPIGWESVSVTRQLENELGFGRQGVASSGDRVANSLGAEVSIHGRLALPGHSRNVSREARLHSKMVDFNPVMQLENEVNAFANVLSRTRRNVVPRSTRGRK